LPAESAQFPEPRIILSFLPFKPFNEPVKLGLLENGLLAYFDGLQGAVFDKQIEFRPGYLQELVSLFDCIQLIHGLSIPIIIY